MCTKNVFLYLLMLILILDSSAIDLCKLLKDKLQMDELVMNVLFDKVRSCSLFMQIV